MKPTLILTLLAAGLASCTTDRPYEPRNQHETIEFQNDHTDVYPDDIRKDIDHYDHLTVAWAGIIVSNNVIGDDMSSDPKGKYRYDTVFKHRYFDWEQDEHSDGIHLLISPRGEGSFRMRWKAHRNDPDASEDEAMKYATPGKLAIVYGTPESIDADGTIVLRYHYIRIIGKGHYTDNELDYGRLGQQPFRPVDAVPTPDATPPSH